MARARKSALTRLFDHFHTHPHGRFQEFLFWAGLGLALGGLTHWLWRAEVVSEPIAWLLAIVALCLFGWAFLPRGRSPPPPKLPPGRRGEIAKKVKESKSEKKRGGPAPPMPPMRRG